MKAARQILSAKVQANAFAVIRSLTVAAVASLSHVGDARAVTQFKKQRLPYQFDITSFTTKLPLTVEDKVETVRMADSLLEARLVKSEIDETIEPLTISLGEDPGRLAEVVERLAHPGREDDFELMVKRALAKAKRLSATSTVKTIKVDPTMFQAINRTAYADLYAKEHHALTVDTMPLSKNSALKTEFFKQISHYFSKAEQKALRKKVDKGLPISVDNELLPEFPRKMVKQYVMYRGPNCFHAALAFQSPRMTSSSLINVKAENGYHRAMINYDELWRAINRDFYEVDPEKNHLKYGDMLVFFDVPREVEDNLEVPVDFRWIRHTATYLFSGYTFSKGSKSSNSPYTVRTLGEEWKTWKGYTKNLAVKVFRRSQKGVKTHPPDDLVDWMY